MFRPLIATLSCELTRWCSYILVPLTLVRRALVVLALVVFALVLALGWLIVKPVSWLVRHFTFRPTEMTLEALQRERQGRDPHGAGSYLVTTPTHSRVRRRTRASRRAPSPFIASAES